MKVLIFLEQDKLKPVGGPLGVGYNISHELAQRNIKSISFLNNHLNENGQKKQPQVIRWLNSFFKTYLFPSKKNALLFQQYDLIHFHSVKALFTERNALSQYKGKVVLTSHSPVPMAMEMYDDIKAKTPWLANSILLKQLRKIDSFAFNRADDIIFPCPQAEEPYYNNWLEYAEIKERKQKNYHYCLTGIVPVFAKNTREDIRKHSAVHDNDFVACYVGRHNEVKGYGNLKNIGAKYLELYPSDHFLICGKEFPMRRLEHLRWKEIGWTDDAYSYIAASDVFILPNTETYFDLVMLEVLSLGKIVIASRTGGNKYFEEKQVAGIFLYETIDEAISILSEVRNMSLETRKMYESKNKKFFEKMLTVQKFVDDYIFALEKIGGKLDEIV